MLGGKLNAGFSKLNTVLKLLRYVSPFYYGKKGLNIATNKAFGKEASELTDEYLVIYLAYKCLRVAYGSVRQHGIAGILKLATLKYIGAILLFNAIILWVKGAYGRYKYTMNYNDATGQFRVSSDPLGRMSEIPKSKELTRADMMPVTVKKYTPETIIPAKLKAIAATVGLSLALRADILLTRVEAQLNPEMVEPSNTPKPLREEWGMEEPDDVDYPLLNKSL